MTANLLDGWFADRAAGAGKPVYSSGSVIVPTNGIVGAGSVSAGTPPTFTVPAVAALTKATLQDGWFVDRAPGDGKPVYIEGSTIIVPTNGLKVVASGSTLPAPGPGGKYYFEITVVTVSSGQVTGAQLGFINPHQRDTIPSTLYTDLIFYNTVNGGRIIAQGRNVDGAVVDYANNASGWICGTQIVSPAVPAGRWNAGDKIGVAVDTINNRFWSRNWTQTAGSTMTQVGTWEGGGNPQTPSNGWDISLLTGNLLIWFGAPGVPVDKVTLNAGFTPWYGLDGTGVIPTGYAAWDATGGAHGNTQWDASAVQGTRIVGQLRKVGFTPVDLSMDITLDGLSASIITTSGYFGFDNTIGSLWSSATAYTGGNIVADGDGPGPPSGRLISFYYTPVNVGPSLNQPVGNVSWQSAIMGVCSNTSKARV